MKKTAQLVITLMTVLVSLSVSAGRLSYPTSPDRSMTPGSLCNRPSEYRYPEKIAYCDRDVSSSLKWQIIEEYNRKLGFSIQAKDRGQFKIDHLIPLCAGGSNNPDNLWPQHESVYTKTDELEATACEKMKEGRLTQRAAIDLLMEAKMAPFQAHEILKKINAL